MCVTEVKLKADLTARELISIKNDISAQNSDGFGEGFEQKYIKTDEGELYTSLWSSDDDYFIKTEQEFLCEEQNQDLGFITPSF